jgi:hypothetical protein
MNTSGLFCLFILLCFLLPKYRSIYNVLSNHFFISHPLHTPPAFKISDKYIYETIIKNIFNYVSN